MSIRLELGTGYCGLACAVCKDNDNCDGCKKGACEARSWCKCYSCCIDKGYAACYECPDFPCSDSILSTMKIRAYARFSKKYGEEEFLKCIVRNKESGIIEQFEEYEDSYDRLPDEDAVINALLTGKLK